MNYISTSLYRKVIDHAIKEGLPLDYFSDLPTSINVIEQIQAVPADQFFALHEKLDERLGPGFSVRVGQEMKIEDYGVLGLSWRTCSWAGEIFARSERYFKLLSDTYIFQVEKNPDVSHIYLHREPTRKGIALSNEATFSAAVVVLQAMTEIDISPVRVCFQHEAPSNLKSHQQAFSCDILFDQEKNYLAYKTQDLELRTAKADTAINLFLVERVAEETSGIQVRISKIIADVEMLVMDALPSGIPSVAMLAEHLGMSNRTLTRRLAEDNMTVRDIIQKIQLKVSKDLLKNSTHSIAEISFQTGFSEQSAFNRAFKRWTGQSPVEFRKVN
ncbi:MAG: AraC family transcriptional regulator ligand-binding domain-containing protein [Reichenbachiella sp.]|uniref:AraC family transcriptional regulator n=1 Tax=Reichenbachiella sp. TaxID=2184521 RepID=UPI003266FC51